MLAAVWKHSEGANGLGFAFHLTCTFGLCISYLVPHNKRLGYSGSKRYNRRDLRQEPRHWAPIC